MNGGTLPNLLGHGFAKTLGLLALLGAPPAWAAQAEFPDEPYQVCPLEYFDVLWEGPGGPGDLIVIADLDAPPEARDYDYAEVSEGNPVTLQAPAQIGEFELRYIRPPNHEILGTGELHVEECVACTVREYPVETHAVAVHVIQSSSGDKVIEHGPIKVKDLCQAGAAVGPAIRDIIDRAVSPLGVSSADIDQQTRKQLRNARDSICNMNEDLGEVNWGTFVYSHCRLAGQSGAYAMDIHLPPGTGDGTMSIADYNEQQVMRMTLKRNIHAASIGTGEGWNSGITMNGIGQGSKLGYPTNIYNFEYTIGLGVGSVGELGQGDMGQIASPQMLGNLVTAKVEGTAHLAQCIPGGNILTAYHENLVREMQFSEGNLGAFAGLVKNQVGMLEHGIPLDITSKTSGRIMGMPMVMGTDRNIVTGFDVVRMSPDWCTRSLMPSGFEVIDIDQQVSQAMGGAQPGMSAEQAAEMDRAMQEMNKAMESMTPEQRAALEQMGLGGMMGGQQPDPPPAAGGTTRSTPSSKSLQGNSLTQTAQNYLTALGYDTGNTSGEMSLETTIAISQFQAENGMEVTGEVTPQLIGLLAARVDGN